MNFVPGKAGVGRKSGGGGFVSLLKSQNSDKRLPGLIVDISSYV